MIGKSGLALEVMLNNMSKLEIQKNLMRVLVSWVPHPRKYDKIEAV